MLVETLIDLVLEDIDEVSDIIDFILEASMPFENMSLGNREAFSHVVDKLSGEGGGDWERPTWALVSGYGGNKHIVHSLIKDFSLRHKLEVPTSVFKNIDSVASKFNKSPLSRHVQFKEASPRHRMVTHGFGDIVTAKDGSKKRVIDAIFNSATKEHVYTAHDLDNPSMISKHSESDLSAAQKPKSRVVIK